MSLFLAGSIRAQDDHMDSYQRHWNNSELYQPYRFRIGGSVGFGGLHCWGKPSADLHYRLTTLHVSPGLNFMSVGFTQQMAFWKSQRRDDRIMTLSFYYHDDWLISGIQKTTNKQDIDMYQLLLGCRVNLNYRATIYMQFAGGVMRHITTTKLEDGMLNKQVKYWPMGEIRIGGEIVRHKEHFQHNKSPIWKNRKHDRVKGVRLKFK